MFSALLAACGSAGGGGPTRFDLARDDGGAIVDMAADMIADMVADMAVPPGQDLTMPPPDLTLPPPDLTVPVDLVKPPDLVKVADLTVLPDLTVVTDLTMPPADLSIGNCHPVINEFMTETNIIVDGGTTKNSTEEFVEVYNPCSAAIDLTGWRLVYRASSNVFAANDVAGDNLLYAWTSVSIPAKGYLVYGGTNFLGTQDDKLKASLAGASGAIGLRDANTLLVDAVAYGSVNSAHGFIETNPAPQPPVANSPGLSLARLPNGIDTDNGAADWKNATVITPRAANF